MRAWIAAALDANDFSYPRGSHEEFGSQEFLTFFEGVVPNGSTDMRLSWSKEHFSFFAWQSSVRKWASSWRLRVLQFGS